MNPNKTNFSNLQLATNHFCKFHYSICKQVLQIMFWLSILINVKKIVQMVMTYIDIN